MSKLLNKVKGFVARNYAYTWLMGMAAASAVYLTPTMAFAAAGGAEGILKGFGGLGAIVIAIIAVVIVIMDAPKIAKGEKAVGGTVVKVLCLLLFAGLILVLTNIKDLAEVFNGIGGNAVNDVVQEAQNIV